VGAGGGTLLVGGEDSYPLGVDLDFDFDFDFDFGFDFGFCSSCAAGTCARAGPRR